MSPSRHRKEPLLFRGGRPSWPRWALLQRNNYHKAWPSLKIGSFQAVLPVAKLVLPALTVSEFDEFSQSNLSENVCGYTLCFFWRHANEMRFLMCFLNLSEIHGVHESAHDTHVTAFVWRFALEVKAGGHRMFQQINPVGSHRMSNKKWLGKSFHQRCEASAFVCFCCVIVKNQNIHVAPIVAPAEVQLSVFHPSIRWKKIDLQL